MFQRLWSYLKTLFRMKAEQAMDPEVEIEQVLQEARTRDQQLRNQAAKVVAHRTMLERNIEQAAAENGKARELAKQALVRADEATRGGDTASAEKWTRTAQSLAMRLQAVESNLESMKGQYEIAVDQAEDAKRAVQQNAMRVQELTSRRMQLLGSVQQAKMQETVNRAMESMSATMEAESPSLERVEQKIEQRLAEAQAGAEIRASTPEGAEAELQESVSLAAADSKLDELRAELGLSPGSGTALPSSGAGAPASSPQSTVSPRTTDSGPPPTA
jgi:phage shock protein A